MNVQSSSAMTGAFQANAASSPTSGVASAASAVDTIGSTFMSLLAQELQNQDPTAPMDSTQMVGQMISLNQLNQLTSINQLLTQQASTSTGSATAGK